MTMATGIISVALRLQDHILLSEVFFVLAILTWLIMTFIYTWRLIPPQKTVIENLKNPRTTFIFFTFVAATDISGILLYQHEYKTLLYLSTGMLWVAEISWIALMLFLFRDCLKR